MLIPGSFFQQRRSELRPGTGRDSRDTVLMVLNVGSIPSLSPGVQSLTHLPSQHNREQKGHAGYSITSSTEVISECIRNMR